MLPAVNRWGAGTLNHRIRENRLRTIDLIMTDEVIMTVQTTHRTRPWRHRTELGELNNRVTTSVGGPDCLWFGTLGADVLNNGQGFIGPAADPAAAGVDHAGPVAPIVASTSKTAIRNSQLITSATATWS